ncbi:MAG TPA: TIGR03752 family integrating conjugative element protein [Gammaproteobacteria bacterium]|nr:TIGR03752 family integrating conjugative element protein [Gammaproteobacteria bacterium]HVY53947.1 TIGR03752 family integrating conjugative element protein [Gammaproteobacteria bacterium]
MAAHKTNGLLKFIAIPTLILLLIVVIFSITHHDKKPLLPAIHKNGKNTTASQDSAAESLDTLTAQLSATQQQVNSVVKNNETLQQQNQQLLAKLQNKKDKTAGDLSQQVAELKDQMQKLGTVKNSQYPVASENLPQPITTIPELADTLTDPKERARREREKEKSNSEANSNKKPPPIPFYTIPPNATAVEDRLMTPLVGRIPVKGVVTDPYPFKIVFSDNTLAANGLRVPNLRQMIVSGYTEGDLNLVSTRGWVTSLTFVFADGTISTTTSNDNDIGHFTKENALGYLSDERGNPAIRGKLITNAPTYLGVNVALGAAQGAANAYAQSQTTSNTNTIGGNSSSVTGSQSAFVAGQAMSNAAGQVMQWWHDREENSFDAVFVPTVKEDGLPQMIVVNFAKEIQIDYDPVGRKIVYAHSNDSSISRHLD